MLKAPYSLMTSICSLDGCSSDTTLQEIRAQDAQHRVDKGTVRPLPGISSRIEICRVSTRQPPRVRSVVANNEVADTTTRC
jgi:hypothetical protein